jgi:hypothetical protein
MRRSHQTLLLGLAGTALWGCSALLGLDRFDGASLAVESEAGDPLDSADAEADGTGNASTAPDGNGSEGLDGTSATADAGGGQGAAPGDDGTGQETAATDDAAANDATSNVADSGDAIGAEASRGSSLADAANDGTSDAAAPLFSYTFDTSTQGWSVFWAGLGDAGAEACSLVLSTTEGDPTPGSLELKAPFNGPSESLNMGVVYGDGGVDLTGRTVTMNVKLSSGLSSDSNHPGYALQFTQDVKTNWADNGVVALQPGEGWITLTMSLDHPKGTVANGFSPAAIHNVGVQFGIPDGPAVSSCSAADIFIDTVVIQ